LYLLSGGESHLKKKKQNKQKQKLNLELSITQFQKHAGRCIVFYACILSDEQEKILPITFMELIFDVVDDGTLVRSCKNDNN
jgi:hypothetical protein